MTLLRGASRRSWAPDESDTSSCDESNDEFTGNEIVHAPAEFEITVGELKDILELCEYNWFGILDIYESKQTECEINALSDRLFALIDNIDLSDHAIKLIKQSKLAYDSALRDAQEDDRITEQVNGIIVTDSESDNPEDYVRVQSLNPSSNKPLLLKRRKAIRKWARRLRVKTVVQSRLLSKKTSKRMSKILMECPDIGKCMEKFVQERNVGADGWRRTGVLTFSGNTNLPQKVTYERIRQHLQKVYKRHFSYGTVVELCVVRNKRRKSSSRYKEVAKITTRRARKGFNLRYNPDSHWSSAFYKYLGQYQFKDGKNITNINRDDASGYRLETLATNKQYATPVVVGNDILTTRTDYVNKYSSVLQVTSYNFTATNSTGEACVGIVKASCLHPKNPCQHATDLKMLETKTELQSVFLNPDTGCSKQIDCIRVDGAMDEGPSHEEVQFYWTERHIMKCKVVTIVTTRSSVSSYLNRVELQNGCLSLGHSNLFIPSTLSGSNVDRQQALLTMKGLEQI